MRVPSSREWEPWQRNYAKWLAMGPRGRRQLNAERQKAGKQVIPLTQKQYAKAVARHRNVLSSLKADPAFRALVHHYQALPAYERWGSIVRAMCAEAEKGNVQAAKFVAEYIGYFVPSMKAQVEGKVEHSHTVEPGAELQKFLPMIGDVVRMLREQNVEIPLSDYELVTSLVSQVVPDIAPHLGPRLQPAHGTANSLSAGRNNDLRAEGPLHQAS